MGSSWCSPLELPRNRKTQPGRWERSDWLSFGSSFSPDIKRHDQSEGLPIGKNIGAPMPPTRFLLCEKPRDSIGSPMGRS